MDDGTGNTRVDPNQNDSLRGAASGVMTAGPGHPRSLLWVGIAFAIGTAVLLWSVNALAVRPALRNPALLRTFLGNLQVFAVAITSAVAASAAWAGNGLGRARCGVPVWVMSLLASLVALASGLGVSWGIVISAAAGSDRAPIIRALQLAGAVGAGFALLGAVVSSLSVELAAPAVQARTHRAALARGAAIVALSISWAAAGIIAAGLARARVCGP